MSQNDLILNALKRGEKITPIEALSRFGCFRLASRVCDIRAMGYDVRKSIIKATNNKSFAQYYLPQLEMF